MRCEATTESCYFEPTEASAERSSAAGCLQLSAETVFSVFSAMGARLEIAGCSLCMGNQARVPDGVNMFSTSTRNFDDRIGNGAQVYLCSAELGAVTSTMGKLPTPAEYLAVYKEKVAPKAETTYKYLQFNEMEGYK